MNYYSFKSQYLGKRYDYDKVYGYQCVDLAKLWAFAGWGLKPHAVGHGGHAKNVFNHADSMLSSKVARRIPNTPTGIPPTGAIIVFDSAPKNIYGHIAVVEKADTNRVTVLEQNANGKGDGRGTGAIRVHTYKYTANGAGVGKVLGWLIPVRGDASATAPNTSHLGGF
jgi:hypothetical protein